MNHVNSRFTTTLAPSSLGARIKAVRMNWRWSQKDMAHALRVDQATISFWERDKVTPSGSGIVALASLFRMSAEAMAKGTGFRIPDAPADTRTSNDEREVPMGVSLPWGGTDATMVVDLGDGSSRGMTPSEAMMSLVTGVHDARRVWVVLE